MMVTREQLAFGVLADLSFGDPRWMPHPVVGVGKWAGLMERVWRGSQLPPRAAGVAAWICVVGMAVAVVALTPWLSIYWVYAFLAVRSLDEHALAVIGPLRRGDLAGARLAVGMIVGRDTADLDEAGVTRAVMETVAENLSDGVIAPLFWLVVAGPVGMAAYKAVNTLDSMWGYRNAKYGDFGWCAARMDDFANWFPARLTAGLIWLVALAWPGMSFLRSLKTTWRDADRQPSPNSGWPEAAAAGALGVRFGGVNRYRGVETVKEFLGEAVRPLTWQVYGGMRVLLYGALAIFVGVALVW